MRSVVVAALVVYLLSALSVAGQEGQSVTVSEFNRMVFLGMEANSRTPFRFTETFRGRVLQFETDGKGSVRTASFNGKTGEVWNECVIVGQRIYERSGSGPWTFRTKANYEKGAKTRSDAMKEASSSNDADAYERLRAGIAQSESTSAAIYRHPQALIGILGNFTSDAVITFVGETSDEDKVLRRFSYRGSTSKFTLSSKELRLLRIEILYGFEKKTGALLWARSRHDWIYDLKTTTHIKTYKWEPDPSIVITEPNATEVFGH